MLFNLQLIERRICMNEVKEYTEKIFDDIKHVDGNGMEYWCARDL